MNTSGPVRLRAANRSDSIAQPKITIRQRDQRAACSRRIFVVGMLGDQANVEQLETELLDPGDRVR